MNASARSDPDKASFAEFFHIWAQQRGWEVPDIHWRAVHWLENRGQLACMRCFRGFAKSTILAIYNAWRYYQDPTYRILHQGDQDKTALKTSRDTKAVLLRHPLTRDKFADLRGEASFWWVPGADDERNPSMQAAGITSTVTSSRCDEAQNDDVEVPRNITNPENREKMRYRLGEQVHIMVPGARQLFIGTPHTHDSLYDEVERMGADCLSIPCFARAHRIDRADSLRYAVPFRPEWVFVGFGESAKLLTEGLDFTIQGGAVVFPRPVGALVDFYAGHAWPERFDRETMLTKRRGCRTINEWDSQYQLHSKPVHEVRLDPARIQAYAVEPRFLTQNKVLTMWLGATQIVGMSLRWDPSSGKINSDISGVVLDLQDAYGRHYWHRVLALTGEIAVTSEDGKKILSGQVIQLCDLIEQFRIPRVTIETNGIGAFAPSFMRMALKQRKLHCAIAEQTAVQKKNERILEALEPLISSGMLWAHADVLNGPLWDQMADWNPAIKSQPDDLLDAGAGAVTDQPVRVGKSIGNPTTDRGDDWRPSGGVYEAEVTSEA